MEITTSKLTCGIRSALIISAVVAEIVFTGCSVTKVEYEKTDKGEVSYRLYKNDHWLNTESTGISGGMTQDGEFKYSAEGMKSSPSEEFNRTMQTYTTAFVQLAQIAAAAYNPSASQAVATATKSSTPSVVVNTQATETKELEKSVGVGETQTQTSNSQSDCADCVDQSPTPTQNSNSSSSDAARTSVK